MSYMALYRKWRPDEFQEVKGQEHIVTTLRNQIKHERIGHAYLFCGTRGTGKTTIAKLMAKAVNCEHPVDGSPCNECESCKAIAAGASMNVIEIDAASNNGVDNIRQINNAVQYSPSTGKYLVYIIDEVHMLSMGAFNALLKTLEEPPAYVIFILATTEAHKIPITIMSRCQRYDFKRISIETIAGRLSDLLEREGISATPDALAYVAKAGDGSMRDALSILDQCIAFNLGEELTYEKVLETIGAVDIDVYISLFKSIISSDISTAIEIVDKAVWEGKDLAQLINEFTTFIRNVLLLKMDPDMKVELSQDKVELLIQLGTDINEESLIAYINILQEAANKIVYASTKRIVLEVAIIKMCKPQMRSDNGALIERIEQLEKQLENGAGAKVVYVNSDEVPHNASSASDSDELSDEAKKKASDEVLKNLKEKYEEADYLDILNIVRAWNYIKQKIMRVSRSFLDKASVIPGEEPGSLDIVVDKNIDQYVMAFFDLRDNIDRIESYLEEITERKIKVNVRKINRNQANIKEIDSYDLSKVNFDIDIK
ncbi:MAG: DNA polymerase III subunit gamma/tau [Lachnospiraceae bacterium]|nr:DNA polymerase III subunit gamma/tau [Lachnospiraceae bacterium]